MKKELPQTASAPEWIALHLTGAPLPIDREFKPKSPAGKFTAEGLPVGLCLGSKSGYRRTHPNHLFVPNANVFCRSHGKVWWGDLDITRFGAQLERVARRLRCRRSPHRLYVLREMDGRFENANRPFADVRRRAVWHTGGPVRPMQRLWKNSGLSAAQIAAFTGVSPEHITSRQDPGEAQQINQRLARLEGFYGPFACHYGFKRWGKWLLTPNLRLNGRTLFDVLCAGEKIDYHELFPEALTNTNLFRQICVS